MCHYSSQSSEIELLIPNVTAGQDGLYTCGAKNRAGEAESSTNVTLLCKTNHNYIIIIIIIITVDACRNSTLIVHGLRNIL